jgi:hypothetical protein
MRKFLKRKRKKSKRKLVEVKTVEEIYKVTKKNKPQKLNNNSSLHNTLKNFHAKKIRCSPKKKEELNMFSCYTDKTLFKLRDLWNARHPDALINSNNGEEIHSQLSKYMNQVCSTESCWLKQNFVDSKNVSTIQKDSFAPLQPGDWKKNPDEWLTSMDIVNVMKQFENAYKCFEFIGPSPIDFDKKLLFGECVWDELCKFSVKDQIKRGKFKLGFIFNTDTHDKSGEHWISMFINIKKAHIYFFDSVGETAPKEVKVFVDRVIKQGKELGIHFKYDENHPVEHQYGETECGIYSLFFIVHMLQDKITEHYLETHVLKDKFMSEFREKYFNKSL